MIKYSIDYSAFSSVSVFPTLSEQTLCTASPEALRVLLYLMQNQKMSIDPQYLAARLMISPQAVEQALDYWHEQGILQREEKAAQIQAEQPVKQTKQVKPIQPSEPDPARVSVGLRAQKKTMNIDEIHTLSQDDSHIQQLVDAVQMQMGKVLTRSEVETLVSFYTYAGLPPEYILLAAAHCCQQNRPNMRALSKLLTDMMSDNIYTYEQAEQYLNRRQRQDMAQGQVCSAFGIHDRALSRQEQKYIDTWFFEYGFDISMIKLAYERTIDQIGKVSFAYINKILESWHSKGITSTKEASTERAPVKSTQQTSSSIDFDQIQNFITYGGAKEPKR